MKRLLAGLILLLAISTAALAANGPEIKMVDEKVSISADNITVGRLLQLFDLATGMKSKVPPELANRNISVRFSGLTMTDAVRKMFQGQTFDYVMIDGQGIVVTAASQNVGGVESTSSAPAYNSAPIVQPADQPFVQDFSPVQGVPFQNPQQQPPQVQTPFGPINNPRAQQQQPNQPYNTPGQQNSLFPNSPSNPQQQQTQQPVQIIPGGQIGQPTPFGTPTPFGAPSPTAPNNNNNSLFGSTTPVGTPAQQQPR
jgi:hypothetical protein